MRTQGDAEGENQRNNEGEEKGHRGRKRQRDAGGHPGRENVRDDGHGGRGKARNREENRRKKR